ncbi:MAG: hypothetical protein PHT59_05180, partial [Candidatus Omnitrophica bacterium]|nr:hypothetical protein [Candidatus Omnitrophota bacterium]
KSRCNFDLVDLEALDDKDRRLVRRMIAGHCRHTRSTLANRLLDNFSEESKDFVKVMPIEYKRILEASKEEETMELAEDTEG